MPNPTSSDQAEDQYNPLAGSLQMRILVELQVLTTLLHDQMGHGDDLRSMRESISRSMISY